MSGFLGSLDLPGSFGFTRCRSRYWSRFFPPGRFPGSLVASSGSLRSPDGSDGIRVEALLLHASEVILQRNDLGGEGSVRGLDSLWGNIHDVFFDRDQQIPKLQAVARVQSLRGGNSVSVEKGAVGRIEIVDRVGPLRSPVDLGVVTRDAIALDTQIIVVEAPNAMGAIAENQFFRFTSCLGPDYELQNHC